MSEDLWKRIESDLSSHSYMHGVQRSQDRIQETAEIFTPHKLVLEILRYLDLDLFSPGKSILDPACGDGQFLMGAKLIKIHHYGMSQSDALRDLYGVDIMRDNVDLCRLRLAGGTIVVGDALKPTIHVEGQTDEEYQIMQSLFSNESVDSSTLKKERNRSSFQAQETLF